MIFEEVLPALRSGKKIRKRYWCKGNYIYINFNEELVTQSGKRFEIMLGSLCDLEKDNWEIIKEKKKVKLRDLTPEQYENWYKSHCYLNEDCEGCVFDKTNCDPYNKRNCWINNKDLYSDKFLEQEIEIEEE